MKLQKFENKLLKNEIIDKFEYAAREISLN